MRFKTIFYFVFVIILIVSVAYNILCTNQLRNDRITEGRITKLNNEYLTEVNSAKYRITELEAIGKAKDRTISSLEADKRKLGVAIKRLEELEQQSSNSVGTIETGNREIGDYLQKLRTIIIGLPRSK